MLLSNASVDFYLQYGGAADVLLLIFIYSMMGQLICKYEPFWQEVSETHVTVKALGHLV